MFQIKVQSPRQCRTDNNKHLINTIDTQLTRVVYSRGKDVSFHQMIEGDYVKNLILCSSELFLSIQIYHDNQELQTRENSL